MKKILYILRHANALEQEPAQTDFARELSLRGQQELGIIADIFKNKGYPEPQKIIHSAAKRTTQTALLFANALNLDNSVCVAEQSIYNAPLGSYLSLIERQSNDVQVLMLVGHNPTTSDLVQDLLSTSRLIQMPTAGLYRLSFEENFEWANINFSKATLEGFEFPENE